MDNELSKSIEDLGTAFNEFKSANDERLESVEKNGSDPHLEAKVERIETSLKDLNDIRERLDDVETRSSRPQRTEEEQANEEHSKAFEVFLRRGTESDLLAKATNVDGGTDSEGGFAVPTELDTNMIELLKSEQPMRQECDQMNVTGGNYEKLVNLGGSASGWVGETAARGETAGPALAKITPTMGEIYANPKATQKSLDDMGINVSAWLADAVVQEFAEEEGVAFVVGNGTDKPIGMLAGPTPVTTVDASRAFGVLQKFVSTATIGAINPDELIGVIYGTRSKYRKDAKWMMNSLTMAVIRKLKQNGEYIWTPGLTEGQKATLLSYAVVENEDFADLAANSFSMTFGNYKRGFMIVDRMGVRVLRDPFTSKPNVSFYTTKRVGSMSTDSNAIKIFQTAAT